MDIQKDSKIQVKRLSADIEYYNNVFKKTEKIVSAIFYILSKTNSTPDSETHRQTIKDRTLKTHETVLESLSFQTHDQYDGLCRFQHELVALESTVRIAAVAEVVPKAISELLIEQIDGVLRYLNNHYLLHEGLSVADFTETVVSKKPTLKNTTRTTERKRRVAVPAGDISTDAYLVYSQLTDRAERIKTVLEAKPQATIKDIAEVITDVSEKTIQRELNSLIEKGQVVREGERRWSRYSTKK